MEALALLLVVVAVVLPGVSSFYGRRRAAQQSQQSQTSVVLPGARVVLPAATRPRKRTTSREPQPATRPSPPSPAAIPRLDAGTMRTAVVLSAILGRCRGA